MTENTTGCKEMTVDDYLRMIENSPKLKEKLKELGITEDQEGFVIPLNYYDLLTNEEMEFLKSKNSQFFPENEEDKSWHVKFGDEPNSTLFCFSNIICDSCHKQLLKIRKHKDYLKP